MFTGMIQHRSRVENLSQRKGILMAVVQKPKGLRAMRGASIAVNGICSTVTKITSTSIAFEYMPETLRKTNIGKLRVDNIVNIETSLTPASLLDGHLTMGHVDTVGRIANIAREGSARTFTVTMPKTFLTYIAPKGSVAMEGVSLTVVHKTSQGFSVSLIPYTLSHTNLGTKEVGDAVNIECDILAKYLHEMVGIRHNAKRRAR